jgi:hypothetical protein
MPKTFLWRSMRKVLISLTASLCLAALAQAQRGGGGGGHGGGGHFGGGQFGGGHSSHAHASSEHTAGHQRGWLHFGRKRAGRDRVVPSNSADEFGPAEMIIRNRVHPLPSTYIRTVPSRSMLSSPAERFSTHAAFRYRPNYFFRSFRRFPGSGCFFNGFNQVCFFEPGWSLLWFSAGFDWFPFDWGFGDDNGDTSVAIGSADMMTAPVMDSGAEEPANNNTIPPQPLRGLDLDPRFFLLILKNGAERVVTDYWLSDGYIEYVGRDGARSHIPIEALDLEETARNNAARRLSFVLRSSP